MAEHLTFAKYQPDLVKDLLRKKVGDRMRAIGILGAGDLKAALSAKGNITGKNPSKPGEDPAKRTGRLAASETYNLDRKNLVLRIGTPVLYGKFLQLGTVKMAARPFLTNFLKRNLGKIKSIMRGNG